MEDRSGENWRRPLAPMDMRSFLVLLGYYRRFFDEFASIAFPLKTLSQKNI